MTPSKADSLMFAIHALELRIKRDEQNHAKTVAFYQERDPEQVDKLVASRERRLSLFHAHLANLNELLAAQVKVEPGGATGRVAGATSGVAADFFDLGAQRSPRGRTAA